MNYPDLFAALGALFYAVSASDGQIAEKEKEKLKEQTRKIWLDWEHSTDKFGSDSAHYISFEFETLLDEDADMDYAWNQFKDFYHIHHSAFNPALRKRIQETAAAVALAKSGYNKAELGILTDLHLLMN
ncbi:MAG: hypothetical protein GC180_02730 [Bacteroidetes bacterium]|nr:hypothetical protein [Bacteroidota bacterium]